MEMFHIFFGNFIDTARMPGMTAQQPANREDASAQGTVALDGRDGITRTGWMEATVPSEPGTQQKTIYLDELYQELVAFRQGETFDDDICLICLDVI